MSSCQLRKIPPHYVLDAVCIGDKEVTLEASLD